MATYGEKALQDLTAANIEETGVSHSKAVDIHKSLRRVLRSTHGAANLWNEISGTCASSRPASTALSL
jgi:hypothetical protein